MNSKKKKSAAMYVHPSTLSLLTDATWAFAHAQLWPEKQFSFAERMIARSYIRDYYQSIPAQQFQQQAAEHFSAFCERILLAKNDVYRFKHGYIPHPCIWLCPKNTKGFTATKKGYEEERAKRIAQRSTLPLDLQELLGIISSTV
jgi:hypothetical protein